MSLMTLPPVSPRVTTGRWNRRQPAHAPCVMHYDTPAGLHRAMARLDREDHPGLVVLLALEDDFQGDLMSLVSRQNPALSLILAVDGRLKSNVMFGDLANSSLALGWRSIHLARDMAAAVDELLPSLRPSERLVVLWPSSRPLAEPLQMYAY